MAKRVELLIAVVAGSLAVLFALVIVALASQVGPVTGLMQLPVESEYDLVARRKISIPFRIDNVTLLNESQLEVSGPGDCATGTTAAIRVMVTSGANSAVGWNRNWNCDALTWRVVVDAVGRASFAVGDLVEVCGVVNSANDDVSGRISGRWCATVTVE